MRYGFVINQNRCIGCHACTVACKEEHNVPIGVNRTWVKYVEKGHYPETQRHFAVLRCNHCDGAPCVEICPASALFHSPNGVVDFDNKRCVGCKSCMQACPYEALYIDPSTKTAAKCNFCAHRLETGLKPSCEIVCPTQAILSGNLDDSTSAISRIVAQVHTSRRKLEQGTHPKLYYVGVDTDMLQPAALQLQSTHLWADKQPKENLYTLLEKKNGAPDSGTARVVYDAPHAPSWGRMITSYLWTKSIAAGVLLVTALLRGTGHSAAGKLLDVTSPAVALAFLTVTTLLLVFDLKRPDRFYYIFTKANPTSWLVLGSYLLVAYGFFSALWLLFGLAHRSVPDGLFWLTALLALGASGYSAFLLAQAKGREFWQSKLLFWHLSFHSVTAGAATLIIIATFFQPEADLLAPLTNLFVLSLLLSLALILLEVMRPSDREEIKRVAALLVRGRLKQEFWWLAIGMGVFLPLLLILGANFLSTPNYLHPLASFLALVGLWVIADLWIKAGQAFPLS